MEPSAKLGGSYDISGAEATFGRIFVVYGLTLLPHLFLFLPLFLLISFVAGF